MRSNEAQLAAAKLSETSTDSKPSVVKSAGTFFRSMPVKMGLHIASPLGGVLALWAVNVPHHSFVGVFRQLVAITVLTCLFVFVRRARSRRRLATDHVSDISIAERERPRKNGSSSAMHARRARKHRCL